MKRVFTLVLLFAFFATLAVAGSLADKKKADDIAKKSASANETLKACKQGVKFGVDLQSFEGNWEKYDFRNAINYCADVAEALAKLCKQHPQETAAVKEINCKFAKSPPEKNFSFANGTVTLTMNWKTSNIRDTAEKFLLDTL